MSQLKNAVQITAENAAGFGAAAGASAAASSVAYAGFGGACLKGAVAIGICNPPLLVVAAPFGAGTAAAIGAGWMIKQWWK